MGEGKMWDSEQETWGEASEILKKKSLSPLTLQAKEGLALINGTQLITSLGNLFVFVLFVLHYFNNLLLCNIQVPKHSLEHSILFMLLMELRHLLLRRCEEL